MWALLAVAVGAAILFRVTPLRDLLADWQTMKFYLDRTEPFSHLVFIGACAILVGTGIPRLPLCAVGGFSFGFVEGLALSQIGCVIGSCIPYMAGRWSAERFKGAGRETGGILESIPEPSSIWQVIAIRQAPISGFPVNLYLGGRRTPWRVFLVGTMAGFFPQAVAATLVGSGLGSASLIWSVGQICAAGFVVFLLGWCVRQGWNKWCGRRVDCSLEDDSHSSIPPVERLVETGLPHGGAGRFRLKMDRSSLLVLVLLAILTSVLFGIRLTGPSDLDTYAQRRNVGYVIDAVERGNWWLPHDLDGQITSKPPLHTWLAAGASMAYGQINRFTLALPSMLAMFGAACAVFLVGRRYMGFLPGFWAAVMFLSSHLSVKHVALVRPDAVFAFTVTLCAWFAFRAWRGEIGWCPFWLTATASVLTKGPLGIVLAGCGLAAVLWERWSAFPASLPQGHGHRVGIGLLVGCVGLWAWFAWQAEGMAVVQKMVMEELLGHATGMGRSGAPGGVFWKPFAYLFVRFAPWSLLTLLGILQVVFNPSSDTAGRQWERFVVCWLGCGLTIFAVAANHRADHLLPLFPAAALLAGKGLVWVAETWDRQKLQKTTAAAVIVMLFFLLGYYHH